MLVTPVSLVVCYHCKCNHHFLHLISLGPHPYSYVHGVHKHVTLFYVFEEMGMSAMNFCIKKYFALSLQVITILLLFCVHFLNRMSEVSKAWVDL